MNAIKVSVITVCYNASLNIELTVNSVLNQDYPNIEYIIIDGGSTDGTVEIIKKYETKISKWLSEPDKGIYDAMNKGIKIATGDRIYFLGAGDELLNVMDKVVDYFKNPDCIYYGNVYIKDLSIIYDGKFPAHKLAVNNISHQAIFYPADVFKKYQYDTRYEYLADHHLNMLCYGDKRFTFKFIPVIVCIYEGNGLSANNPDITFIADKPAIVRKNFPFWVKTKTTIRRTLAK